MPDKFHIMSGMARLDAVHTDGIAIGRVARLAPVEIVHRERCVTRNLIQALPVRDRLLNCILIVENLISTDDRLDATR